MEIQRSAQHVMSTEHVNITLKFDAEGHAGGDSTCNYYGVDYQTGPDQALTFHNLISTLKACVDTSLMDLENEYYKALEGVATYSFDGITLQLFYNNGDSVLKFGGGSSPSPTIPGMPRTGGDGANQALFIITGLLLVLFGAGLLASTKGRQSATK
jgi:heat shock protein HslJ